MNLHRFHSIAAVSAFIFLSTTPLVRAQGMTHGQSLAPFARLEMPGEYVWFPEISPAGPVVIVVSLTEQILSVYRNGVRIGRSTISSGKAGHHTPTGVFTILQKNVKHTSTLFKGASMPYMERLTWRGIAMHGGNLPGHPASHGCVRLPLDFAQQLYGVTSDGTTVIITDNKAKQAKLIEPGFIYEGVPENAAPPGDAFWLPEKSPAGPVSIVLSSSGTSYIYRNGIEIGRSPVGGLGKVKGTFVYSALASLDSEGSCNWLPTIGTGGLAPNIKDLLKQVVMDPMFSSNVHRLITSGTNLILTDAPAESSTSGDDAIDILTTSDTP
jgi:L,D-transpeptidase catalytic domain